MTIQELCTINYVLGKLEGISCAVSEPAQSPLIDCAELLQNLLDKAEGVE